MSMLCKYLPVHGKFKFYFLELSGTFPPNIFNTQLGCRTRRYGGPTLLASHAQFRGCGPGPKSGSLPLASCTPQKLSGTQMTLGRFGLAHPEGVDSFLSKHLFRITHHHHPHCSPVNLCLFSSLSTWTLGSVPQCQHPYLAHILVLVILWAPLQDQRFGSHLVFDFAYFVCLFFQN